MQFRLLPVLSLLSLAAPAFAGDAPVMSYLKDSFLDSILSSRSPLAPFGEEARPAPLSIRSDITLVYNTPSPSQVKPELIGPVQFIRTARVDEDAGTVTFPLYEGHNESGENAWYILTDTTSRDLADHLGLAFTAKLGYVDQGKAVRPARFAHDGTFVFSKGKVDFSPERKVMAGAAPNFFPPRIRDARIGRRRRLHADRQSRRRLLQRARGGFQYLGDRASAF